MKSFSLFCTSAITIGLSWSAGLNIKVKSEKIELWFSSDDEEKPKVIKEFEKNINYRTIIHWMIYENDYYLTGSFSDLVTTNGLSQIWSDLFSFSWVKNEDGINRESLMTFMEIDDNGLKTLWRSKNDMTRNEFLTRSHSVVSKFQSRFGKDLPIKEMFKWADSKSNLVLIEEKFKTLDQEEENIHQHNLIKEERLRNKILKPFLNQIEVEIVQWKEKHPYRGGTMNAMLRDRNIDQFRRKIEDYVVKNNKIPDSDSDLDGMSDG